jgi:ABC-type transport system substrate-binding protein/DNA-binding SARP family transcriptional activator
MESVFRILGPLEVELDERVVSLGGRRERAILAILLLNSGEVVSVERLIDGLWGEARPSSAKHMVHEYVSRLRTALVEVAPIATRPPGYMLESAGEALDVRQFTQLTGAARAAAGAHHHANALGSYDQALALWRGDALADIALEGHAQIATARLDQERRLVGEERIDCALALGQHLQLIPELQHRADEAPLRERTRAQLMLALYRAGRQTEALERYRDGRALLVEHAGVEPGRELRDLERAILTHDRALELEHPMRDHAVAEGAARVHSPKAPVGISGRRRWRRVVVSGVLLAAAAGTLIFAVGRTNSAHALARIDANSAGAIDPGHNRLVDEVPVGTGPGRIAAGFASLWVVNDFDSTISRIDPTSGTAQVIPVGGDPTAIAVGAGFVWVACTGTRSVDRIDPNLNKRTQRISVGNGPSGIAISPGAVWVTNRLDDTVTEIDSRTGHFRRTLPAGSSPSDIAYGLGALWIANESASSVTRLDPRTGGLQTFNVGNGPEAVTVAHNSIWVANSLDGTASRINPNNNVVATFPVGQGPSSVLLSDGAIWVADSYGGQVVRINPATGGIVRTISVGSGPQSLAAIGGRIWLSARETTGVHRGGTLRLFDYPRPDSLDEGVGSVATALSVFSNTGDGLVGFKRVGGLDGATPVPDLATSLPKPTDGGRTYTFQLQRGIRYSNGEPVRASDLRRALERDFRLRSDSASYYEELLGAGACSKSRCDLSRGVVADDKAGTVILHLRQPDPELLYKLALPAAYPVPQKVSMTKPARLGVPGTGPYMIRSYKHSHLVLVRNPRFREWSAAAQPNGYPDRIELTYNEASDEHLTTVEHGKADVIQEPLPTSRMDEIRTRYAAQVHIFPFPGTYSMFLNMRLPPFDNLKAREAVNYAVDRAKAVAGVGGADAAAVTCQILPAGMAAYRPYCPYTRNPTRSGVWSGPDLAKALKLVAASGTSGQKVIFWTSAEAPFGRPVGNLALATLKQLGYAVKLKIVPGDVHGYFDKILDPRSHAQAGFNGWGADYPAASGFFSQVFTCPALQPANQVNPSHTCNRRVDRAVERALTLQTTAPAASNAAWVAADRLVTNIAPWVPLLNPRTVVVVSRRVQNVQSNPQWGLLIDQIWVK